MWRSPDTGTSTPRLHAWRRSGIVGLSAAAKTHETKNRGHLRCRCRRLQQARGRGRRGDAAAPGVVSRGDGRLHRQRRRADFQYCRRCGTGRVFERRRGRALRHRHPGKPADAQPRLPLEPANDHFASASRSATWSSATATCWATGSISPRGSKVSRRSAASAFRAPCMSRSRTNCPSSSADIGEQQVKNIPNPVHAYHIEMRPDDARSEGRAAKKPGKSPAWIMPAAVAAACVGVLVVGALAYLDSRAKQRAASSGPIECATRGAGACVSAAVSHATSQRDGGSTGGATERNSSAGEHPLHSGSRPRGSSRRLYASRA